MESAFRFAAATLAVALLAGLVTTASAQEIPKPTRAVGEWCEYKDLYGNPYRSTVTDVRGDGSFVLNVGDQVREFDPEHRMVKRDGRPITPYWGQPDFPIKVGQTGEWGPFAYTTLKGRAATATVILQSVTPEKVTVPAGTFETLRVETMMRYTLDSGFANRLDSKTWYAIDGRSVKWESIDYGVSGSGGRTETVLLRCGKE